jgi:hypothetical protein
MTERKTLNQARMRQGYPLARSSKVHKCLKIVAAVYLPVTHRRQSR